jgi:hypothetical protein
VILLIFRFEQGSFITMDSLTKGCEIFFILAFFVRIFFFFEYLIRHFQLKTAFIVMSNHKTKSRSKQPKKSPKIRKHIIQFPIRTHNLQFLIRFPNIKSCQSTILHTMNKFLFSTSININSFRYLNITNRP